MWFQLYIPGISNERVSAISDVLETLGAVSVSLLDAKDAPVLEPAPGATPLWPEVDVQALFTTEQDALRASLGLKVHFPDLDGTLSTLQDKAWERVWMDTFKPMRFGQRLWICPSWAPVPDADAVNLMLDPGLAFGTGSHPTTALCLTWLDGARLSGKTVIDYGCGSGILALAALKLDAERVFAVDIDPQALTAATANAAGNDLLHDNRLLVSFPEDLSSPADILLANILLGPLQSLKTRFCELLEPDGLLVVSGILREQADSLVAEYKDTFTLETSNTQEDWALLVFRKLKAR